MLYGVTLGLGDSSRSAAQFSEALHYYGEATKLLPAEPAPHRRMADVYIRTGHPDQATAEQQEADRLEKILAKPGG